MAVTPKAYFRCDRELRAAAAKVFNEAGLTFSAGLLLYLKAVVREGRIPFEVRGDGPVELAEAQSTPTQSG